MEPWTSGKNDIMTYIVRDGRAILLISTPRMIGDLFAIETGVKGLALPLFEG